MTNYSLNTEHKQIIYGFNLIIKAKFYFLWFIFTRYSQTYFYVFTCIMYHKYILIFILTTQMLLSEENEVLPEPTNWSLVGFAQEKMGQIHILLLMVRQLLQKIIEIQGYVGGSGDINEMAMRIIQSNLPSLNCQQKKAVLKGLVSPLFAIYEKVQQQQRKVYWSFIEIMQAEIQKNMDVLRALNILVEDEYTYYIKQELLKSLIILKLFISRENKFYTEYYENSVFFHRFLGQQGEAIQNRNQEIPQAGQIIQLLQIEDYIGPKLNRLQFLSEQFKKLYENITESENSIRFDQNSQLCNFSSTKLKILTYSLLFLLVICLGWLIYALSIFDDFERLSKDQQAWTGAGAYLAYQWINCFLANYCYSKQINVLLGMCCKSPQEILFFRPYWLTLLLFLTIIYVCLFFVYLLWVGVRQMGMVMNGILVVLWIVEFIYRLACIQDANAFSERFSFLHFLTLFIPINDIIGSLLIDFGLERNETIVSVVYMVIAIACICRKQLVNTFINLFAVAIIVQLVIVFLSSSQIKIALIWAEISFNIIILTFSILSKYKFISLSSLLKGLQSILSSFCCCTGTLANLNKLRLDEANSYHRIIKVLLIMVSIIFVLITPFGVHWTFIESLIGLHRYGYFAIVLFGYFAWSFLYINEININLKHPLGNMTRLGYSVSLDNGIQHVENEEDFRFDCQSLKKRAKALQQFNRFDVARLEVDAKVIQESLSQNFLFQIV